MLAVRMLIALGALASAPLAAQTTLVGEATAIDGDSLSVGGMDVRLFGSDAPETKQTCLRDGIAWTCGQAAAGQLASLVAAGTVTCRARGTDDYGRALAVCSAGGMELNRTMVASGWATAFRRYSQDYVADETRAKLAKVGIWAATFDLPEDYRRMASEVAAERATPASAAPQRLARPRASVPAPMGACAIKGNRNRKGQWIYHFPGMPYYEATRAEEIFCTEAQAQAAGYRRAIVK